MRHRIFGQRKRSREIIGYWQRHVRAAMSILGTRLIASPAIPTIQSMSNLISCRSGLASRGHGTTGLNQDWPPYVSVSPGWHLADAFAGFEGVRGLATGNGVRIAHLDTGYWPPHDSTPRLVKRGLGYNFYENKPNTTDPGLGGSLRQPGHGTATIAILAGNTVEVSFFKVCSIREIWGSTGYRKLYR